MGFLDFFRPKVINGQGTFAEVDIVGESFQVESFKIIRQKLGKSADTEADVSVELRNEPENPHAKDGKAVAAYVLGHKVGYVSSFTAIPVFDSLGQKGGTTTLPGRIYFGDLRENPPKNSVSIKMSIQIKSIAETNESETRYQRDQEIRRLREIERDTFLRNPEWSKLTLSSGDSVTFTGFTQWDELPKLADSILGVKSKTGSHLLVLHPSIESDSAKLRDWLAKKKPATNLVTFLENNPLFAAYFNESTKEFDVPSNISGKKPIVSPPKATRVFESDNNLGAPTKKMPSDVVLLPEQTLATYPSFTIYGHFNWRLSDLKLYKPNIEKLFEQVGGQKTDGIVIRGSLIQINLEGVTRLEFQLKGVGLGLVPKNETETLIRDGKSWQENAVLALITWDFKNILKGEHDSGLTEKYFIG